MTTMEGDIVPDRDIISDLYRRLLIQGMEYGSVLDIDVISDADGVYIATEDSVEPNATALT